MSLSATQTSATQKLLEHIRSTPQKDASGSARTTPPLPTPPVSRRSLFGGERVVVGVTVSKGKITLAQRCTGGAPLLEAVQIVQAPDITDWETPGCAEKVREALDAFLPEDRRETDIWVHLPEGQAELRHYRIPKVSPKDRDAIAKMTAIREKPYDESENIFDYRINGEVMDKGVPRQPVTAMIANKNAVETLRQRLTGAGISPAGITSSSICAQNLFASGWLAAPWQHFAFANIEEDSTHIEIFSGSTIALSRTIKTGLRSLVTALQESHGTGIPRDAATAPTKAPVLTPVAAQHLPMDALGGTFSEALPLRLEPQAPSLALLTQSSLADEPPAFVVPDDSLSYADGLERLCNGKRRTAEEEASLLMQLAQPLGRLARQLERTADHFRNAMGMPNIQGVIVFAPGGCLPLALKKFESALGIPCRPLRFDGQATPGAATDLHAALAQTTDDTLLQAIGLTLSSPDYTPNAIMTYAGQQLRERRMRITFLSFCVTTVALALLLAFCGKMYMNYLGEKQHRAELETRIASMGTLYDSNQLKTNLSVLQQIQTQARALAKRRIAAALITELSISTPDTVHLTGLRVTFKDAAPNNKEQPARRGAQQGKTEAQESAVAVLTGTVTGDVLQRESRLAEFLSQMEHSPLVLSLLVEKQQTDTEILSFVATLRLV